jgi:hypothetical protein
MTRTKNCTRKQPQKKLTKAQIAAAKKAARRSAPASTDKITPLEARVIAKYHSVQHFKNQNKTGQEEYKSKNGNSYFNMFLRETGLGRSHFPEL